MVYPQQSGDLVRAAARGDPEAWTALVEAYSGLVWSVPRGYHLSAADAADVYQTVWLRLAEHLSRIENPDHVGGWLATTARRESLRVAQTSTKVVLAADTTMFEYPQEDTATPEQAVLDAEQTALDSERAKRVWQAFAQLSVRCQQLLRMLFATPPPNYAEVAAALDMRVGSVGPTRMRCLENLRRRLADEVSEIG